MRRLLSLSFAAVVAGCAHPAPPPPSPPTAQKPTAPPTPVNLGIDETAIDSSVSPCDDFYLYACGNWLKRTEIPADKSQWSRSFNVIAEENLKDLHQILESAAKGEGNTPYAKKLGDFYASCMDESAIEAKAPAELKEEWARVDAVKNTNDLVKEVAHLHMSLANPMFGFGQQQDYKNANDVIGALDQAGLGLPDRDYYLQNTGKFPELRKKYLAHVEQMMLLAGEKPAQAKRDAATVMRLETGLAKASMSLTDRRDPRKVYHRLDLAGIQKAMPRWNWKLYLTEMGVPTLTQINVTSPEFFKALNQDLRKVSMADWKTYLRWHVVHAAAPSLSKPFVDENFAFFGKALNGIAELEPRWKRCAHAMDGMMGEALGQAFVAKHFSEAEKAHTERLVREVEAAMHSDIEGLAWFDDSTRAQALAKLAKIGNKIGYPDKWRNYDALDISRGSYLKDVMAAGAFETKRQLDKIGKPLDRTEWLMTPPTVNAYNDYSMNEMVFPAGILQPPFYNPKAVEPVNYGAIGMVMGHELTHGFDDQGRKFDANGNLRDWWSPAVNKDFEKRAQCVIDQYDGFVAVDDLHLNGKLTLGENIADLGGIKLAHAAYQKARGANPPPKMGKFTDEQLFFLGTAQAWCTKRRPERSRMLVTTDPHSPPHYRVDGAMSNLSSFAAAFQCKPGDKMVRKDQCVVW